MINGVSSFGGYQNNYISQISPRRPVQKTVREQPNVDPASLQQPQGSADEMAYQYGIMGTAQRQYSSLLPKIENVTQSLT